MYNVYIEQPRFFVCVWGTIIKRKLLKENKLSPRSQTNKDGTIFGGDIHSSIESHLPFS